MVDRIPMIRKEFDDVELEKIFKKLDRDQDGYV